MGWANRWDGQMMRKKTEVYRRRANCCTYNQIRRNGEHNFEGGLDSGFVPAREGTTSINRLELGRGNPAASLTAKKLKSGQ